MISVVIADDHHLVRQGIKALLEKAEDIAIVAEAEDGQQAVQLVTELQPDILVTDIAMPRLNGIQALDSIKQAHLSTRIIILSMYSDEMLVRQALQKGASGYLLKRSVTEELLLAVRAAVRGETYVNPEVAKMLMDSNMVNATNNAEHPLDRLTAREIEVLKLVAEGHTNREIAQIINITTKTVEKHRANVMQKLDLHDLSALIRFAIKHHIISLDA